MDNNSVSVNYDSHENDGLDSGETIYAIGIGMLWDRHIHGNYPEHLKDKWIVMDTIGKGNFYHDGVTDELINFYTYHTRSSLYFNHPIFPNYDNIMRNKKYFTIDIFEMKCLPTLEIIGVKKTFWIRMIQRRWKKLYKERLNIIKKRKNPVAIKHCQLHGKWGHGLSYLPSIRDIINF